MALQQILSFFKTYKKVLFFISIFFSIFFIFGDVAFAEGETPLVTPEVSEKIVTVLNGIITGAAAIMGLVTSFVTIFLYPGWVNGTMFGLEDYLKIIWIFVSNVVYFIFAFILIAIAFMNIIGKGEGTWELKQAMPKFIVGVLIVPFSWFFVQFLLSISAVLTVGVLTIPYESFQSESLYRQGLESLEDEEICKDVIINFSDEPVPGATTVAPGGEETLSERIVCKNEGSMVSVREILDGTGGGAGLQNSVFGVINLYTYGILKVQELDTITGTDLESITKIADLIFKIIFDILFILVYMLLMIALMLALFVRGVRLWVYMMLSPAFGLLYFFGKGSTGVGKSGDKFNIKEFVALALVPVYVSAALAFGLVFILVASEGIKQETSSTDEDTIEAGGFSLTIKGAHGDGESEKSPIAKLIVEMFGVAILWIAVMAALGASKTTEAIVKPIADFGESVGKLAAAAPTYAPIIPTGNRENPLMSITSLASAGNQFSNAVSGAQTSRGSQFGTDLANRVGIGNTEVSNLTNAMSGHTAALESSSSNIATLKPAFRDLLRNLGGAQNFGSNRQLKEQFHRYMSQIFGEDYTGEMQTRINGSNGTNIDETLQQIFRQLQSGSRGDIITQSFPSGVTPEAVTAILAGSAAAAAAATPPSNISIDIPSISNVTVDAGGNVSNIGDLTSNIGETNLTLANEGGIRNALRLLRADENNLSSPPRFSASEIDHIIEALHLRP